MNAEHFPAPNWPRAWIVIPTYNERENVERLVAAVRASVPDASILIVDDGSPDGTGQLADLLASADEAVHVLHRSTKDGLGQAYRAGFATVLSDPSCGAVVQMDCDFSHDPAALPALMAGLARADLVIGSRYVPGGSIPRWSARRRMVSRMGSAFAQLVLGIPYADLTGGFKAWNATVLRSLIASDGYASGYGFQVEMTYRAHRTGAKITEVPITFGERAAGESKMTVGIAIEAAVAVLRMRTSPSPRS